MSITITNPTEVAREPSRYELTNHAWMKMRERGISRSLVDEAIQRGAVQHATGHGALRYLYHVEGHRDPIGVVVDVPNRQIVTAYWNTCYDHPELDGHTGVKA